MKFLILIFMLVLSSACNASSHLHMIDVNQDGDGGHGDAYLMRSAGKSCLVDAGQLAQARKNLAPRLLALGITHLDCFINTHPHTDHLEGLVALSEAGITIGTMYHSRPPLGVSDWAYIHSQHDNWVGAHVANGMKRVEVKKGDVIDFGDGTIEVIFAHKGLTIGNGSTTNVNNFSIVFVWEVGNVRTMFTGDIEVIGGNLVSSEPKAKAHIFTAPHHGGLGGSRDLYLNSDAMVHLYSSTKEIFNLLSHEPRSWTSEANAKLCHNGYNGEVVFRITEGAFNLVPQRPNAQCPSGNFSAPKMKVSNKKNLSFLPAIYYLLSVGPFDNPPDYSLQVPGAEVEQPAD